MRAVVQRVRESTVRVGGETVGRIGKGLVVLLAVEKDDDNRDMRYLADKIAQLRIFSDGEGKMNRSVTEEDGEILVVSQFTLYGDCRKGNRPSFDRSALAEPARNMVEAFVAYLEERTGKPIQTGQFGAMMNLEIHNDGPVTLILESRK